MKILITALTFVISLLANAQVGQGILKGKITDAETGEELGFVNVVIEQNGVFKDGAASDLNGGYQINSISPGKYTLKVSYIGYESFQLEGLIVNSGKITFYDVKLNEGVELDAVEVVHYVKPLIDRDGGATGETVTREDIARLPSRSVQGVAKTVGGVYENSKGELNVRGARKDATVYYVDGVKVRGNLSIPKSAVEEVAVLLGGLPASYGDATGGIISVTSRAPSNTFNGGIDGLSSGVRLRDGDLYGPKNNSGYGDKIYGLDSYAYNLAEGYLSGPLLKKKDSTGTDKALLGFFISGNYSNKADADPSYNGTWRIKEEVRNSLLDPTSLGPLRSSSDGSGSLYNTDFLQADDFEKVKWQAHNDQASYSGAVKLYYTGIKNADITLGGQLDGFKRYGNSSTFNDDLLNFNNGRLSTRNNWRVFARWTQKLFQKDQSGFFKNVYYSVMIDNSVRSTRVENSRHGKNFFNYGYVGKFETVREKTFQEIEGQFVKEQTAVPRDSIVYFTPSDINYDLAAITGQYFNLFNTHVDHYENNSQIVLGNALLNGTSPTRVYSMWNNLGNQYDLYREELQNQLRVTGSINGGFGDHNLSLGFEYEKRTDRQFNVNPVDLWTTMRQYANAHITELDKSAPSNVYTIGTFKYIEYDRLNASPGEYDATNTADGGESQFFFDYNLRKLLDEDTDGVTFIDVDAVDPDLLSLNLFSADELLNGGGNNSFVSYYGYDHTGKKTSNDISFSDFFTSRDEYGNPTRLVAPFEPIYAAGYLMDKFAFEDLVFNVGLRVDWYDANQKVLKDKYLFREAYTAGETAEFGSHPANIGDDYVVYVDDINDPSAINGYRNGEVWYNNEGTQVDDPTVINTQNGIAPYFKNENSDRIDQSAFKDYEPQLDFLPRIAFSFPISDKAVFFAHYDHLTRRPGAFESRLDLLNYYYINNAGKDQSRIINNPDLKPEKTIDYEFGFQQVLSSFSALKIAMFYRQMKNMVQVRNVVNAFPTTYKTYGNLDFGTTKGMTISLDLRKTGNLRVTTSYTLQFADGTGSNSGTGLSLVNSNQPNLRIIQPLDFDRRHAIITNVDFRYGSGIKYNGPKIGNKNLFERTGINMLANLGSGTPYSAQGNIVNEAEGSGARSLKGQINGARKPWQITIDAQIDRFIPFNKEKEDRGINIYVQINNVFNIRNVLNVYRATGNAEDDGFLADENSQNQIARQNNETAYRNYYALKLLNPSSFGQPRTIRLGASFNF